MTAAAAKITTMIKADPVEVFTARCEARAHLWASGDIPDLHEAVDKLQHDAVRDGLVAKIGQDEVQAIMSRAFAAVRKPVVVEPVDVVPDPLPEPPKRGDVPKATLDAADWLVRQDDPDRLRRWLNGRSAKERNAIQKHIEEKRCSARNR